MEDYPVARRAVGQGSIFNTLENTSGFTYVDRVRIASQSRPSWQTRLKNEQTAIIRAFEWAGQDDRAARIHNCGQELITYRDAACGATFGVPRRCRDRFCPYCAEKRAGRILARKLPLLSHYHHYVFLTLTFRSIEHVTYGDIQFAFHAWTKLWGRKFMKEACYGAIATFEVTYGQHGFHPHLHVLIALRHRYLSIEDVRAAWDRYTRAPWCHIDPVKPPLAYAVLELVKYPLKLPDFYDEPLALSEYATAIDGVQLIRGCGCFDRLGEAFKPHAPLSLVPCPRCGVKGEVEKIGNSEPIGRFRKTPWGWELEPDSLTPPRGQPDVT